MSSSNSLCSFCESPNAFLTSLSLLMCSKCCPKYSYICLLFLHEIGKQELFQSKGWSLRLLNSSDYDVSHDKSSPVFYVMCSKKKVRVVTAIDRPVFFAMVSRLSTDLQSWNTKKSTILGKKRKRTVS